VTTDVVLALDVGASKFAAGLVDARGNVLDRRQSVLARGASVDDLLAQLVGLARRALDTAPEHGATVAGCGIAASGPVTRNLETVSPVNLPVWREVPLRAHVEQALGLQVAGDLDSKALTLGEWWVGSAVGERNFMALVVSTGIGGGLVVDGQLLEGASGNAGHVGHVVVQPDGRECGCGGTGCVEAEASGTAIEAITGRPPAEANAALVARSGRLVGRAVATVMNLLDIAHAVVAGSVALGFGEPFFAAAQGEIDADVHSGGRSRPLIEPSRLGADAPLVGAAAVAWRALGRLDTQM
jgi:glucokinase